MRKYNTRDVMYPNSMGTQTPALEVLPDLALCSSPAACPSVSFIMSFNELVNRRRRSPGFCELLW